MKNFIKMLSMMNSQRYSRTINEMLSKKIPCGFFCAFDAAPWKIQNAIELKNAGINLQFICLADGVPRTNLHTDGIPIVTLNEFKALASKPQLMLHFPTDDHYMFDEFFYELGVEAMILNDVRRMEEMYEEMYDCLADIVEVYQLFEDEESRATYRASLTGRMTGQSKYYRYAPEPQYWLEPFAPVEGNISIDGGAYRFAENAIDFASRGAKVYAFEMNLEFYQQALPLAEKYHFTLENMGLFSEEQTAPYISAGVGSRILPKSQQTGLTAHFIDLDTYVKLKGLPRIDHIKLDIESAELDCLKGAAKTIVRWKPKLAISAYHKPDHLWTLAQYIKSLRADYKFAFRHYRANLNDAMMSETQREYLRQLGLRQLAGNASEMVLYAR